MGIGIMVSLAAPEGSAFLEVPYKLDGMGVEEFAGVQNTDGASGVLHYVVPDV